MELAAFDFGPLNCWIHWYELAYCCMSPDKSYSKEDCVVWSSECLPPWYWHVFFLLRAGGLITFHMIRVFTLLFTSVGKKLLCSVQGETSRGFYSFCVVARQLARLQWTNCQPCVTAEWREESGHLHQEARWGQFTIQGHMKTSLAESGCGAFYCRTTWIKSFNSAEIRF
jgi:hypothetical protein